MTRIAIIAALPGELQPLVRGWSRERRPGVDLWRSRQGGTEWIAACAGVGAGAAVRAWAEAASGGAIDRAVSAGWAGATRDGLIPGRAYPVAGVIDAVTGERWVAAEPAAGACWLATCPGVADPAEKRRLAAVLGADLVDMEAAAIARAAAAQGIPFHCVKGVTDGPADRLPDFSRFISKSGQLDAVGFAFRSLLHPTGWPALYRLARNSRRSAGQLRDRLRAILEERR